MGQGNFFVPVPEWLMRRVFTGKWREKPCSHLADIQVVHTELAVCEACVARGDGWLSLRMCLTCGFVGCCDQNPNQHSRKHHLETGHPLVRIIDRGEGWIWCYVDEAFIGARSPQLRQPMPVLHRHSLRREPIR